MQHRPICSFRAIAVSGKALVLAPKSDTTKPHYMELA
jgi:hypothetical protein